MNNQDMQRLLAAAGYYKGAIDGIMGAGSTGAVTQIINNHYTSTHSIQVWTKDRRAVAACQLILKYAGYEVGEIDGWVGNLTIGALLEWNHQQVYGERLNLSPLGKPVVRIETKFPKQYSVDKFYGQPGVEIKHQLVYADLPYKMVLDYNMSETVSRIRLHKKCIESAINGFEEIEKYYTASQRAAFGLDRYAGGYMHRRMRGGKAWSMHAYGCAMDFYAAPNGLTTRCPDALFCRPEYKAFFDIWESHGWVSLGRAIGRDWMHIQAAGL